MLAEFRGPRNGAFGKPCPAILVIFVVSRGSSSKAVVLLVRMHIRHFRHFRQKPPFFFSGGTKARLTKSTAFGTPRINLVVISVTMARAGLSRAWRTSQILLIGLRQWRGKLLGLSVCRFRRLLSLPPGLSCYRSRTSSWGIFLILSAKAKRGRRGKGTGKEMSRQFATKAVWQNGPRGPGHLQQNHLP